MLHPLIICIMRYLIKSQVIRENNEWKLLMVFNNGNGSFTTIKKRIQK